MAVNAPMVQEIFRVVGFHLPQGAMAPDILEVFPSSWASYPLASRRFARGTTSRLMRHTRLLSWRSSTPSPSPGRFVTPSCCDCEPCPGRREARSVWRYDRPGAVAGGAGGGGLPPRRPQVSHQGDYELVILNILYSVHSPRRSWPPVRTLTGSSPQLTHTNISSSSPRWCGVR